MMDNLDEAARAAYETCRVRYPQVPLPEWGDQSPVLKDDWRAYMRAGMPALCKPADVNADRVEELIVNLRGRCEHAETYEALRKVLAAVRGDWDHAK